MYINKFSLDQLIILLTNRPSSTIEKTEFPILNDKVDDKVVFYSIVEINS